MASELTSLLVKQGSATTKSLTLSYNRDGDRTGQTDSVGGGTVGYTYDQADRLTGYSKGGSQWTYAYDGDGLRQTKAITSTVEPYTYDLAEGLPTIVQDGATRYLTGPGGLPVEQVDGSGNVLYYRQDQLGSTRALVDGSGAVKAQFTYDAYGNTVAISGTATTPFGYAGQYTDAESGLQYLRARYYDPATAQFLSVDPIVGATGEPYAYAFDSPVNVTDPSGLGDCGFFCDILNLVGNLGHDPLAKNSQTQRDRGQFLGDLADAGSQASCFAQIAGDAADSPGVEIGLLLIPGADEGDAVVVLGENAGKITYLAGKLPLFERTFETAEGPVTFAAEVIAHEGSLWYADAFLYGQSGERVNVGIRQLREGLRTLASQAKAWGFTELRISGERVPTSSSANPGWKVEWILDLTKH